MVNWRPFERLDPPLRLTSGINVIYGENGSGKSSLLDAILYGLYGELPYNLADAVSRNKDYAKVELKLELSGETYVIQRTIRLRPSKDRVTAYTDSASTKLVYPDGRFIIGANEVTKKVEELLGVSGRLFSETLYIRQGRLREIIEKSGRRRAEYLDRIIGTLDLENCYNNSRALIQWAETLKGRCESTVDELKRDVEKLSELRREYDDAKARFERLGEEINMLLSRKREAEEEAERLEGIYREIEDVEKRLGLEKAELSKVEAKLEDLRSRLEEVEEAERELAVLLPKLEELEGARESYDKLREEVERRSKELVPLKRLKEELDRLRGEERRLKKRVEKGRKEVERLNELKERAEGLKRRLQGYEGKEERARDLRRLVLGLGGEVERLKKTIENLRRYGGGRCPTCLQEVKAEYAEALGLKLEREVEEKERELSRLKGELEKVEEELESLKADRDELLALTSKLEGLEEAVEELNSELGELEEVREKMGEVERELEEAKAEEAEIDGLREELKRLGEKVSEFMKLKGRAEELKKKCEGKATLLKGLDGLETERAEREGRCSELAKRLEELKSRFDERRLAELKGEIEELSLKVNEAEKERSRLEGWIKRVEKDISSLEEKERRLGKVEEELKRWERVLEVLTKIRKAFREAQPILRRQFVDSINAEAQRILSDLKKKESIVGIVVGEDYSINVVEGGRENPIEQYSGGEKTLVSIVLRTALAKALVGEIPMLIYDEPTEYLDEGHRERLVNWISGLGEVGQVIVVSQLEDFNPVASNIREVRMVDGRSTVV